MLQNGKRVYVLAEYTVEHRNNGWYLRSNGQAWG